MAQLSEPKTERTDIHIPDNSHISDKQYKDVKLEKLTTMSD